MNAEHFREIIGTVILSTGTTKTKLLQDLNISVVTLWTWEQKGVPVSKAPYVVNQLKNYMFRRMEEMPPKPIEKPDFVTKEWIAEQKENGMRHEDLAEHLHVSRIVIQRWLREVGYAPGDWLGKLSRKKSKPDWFTLEWVSAQGKTREVLYEDLGVTSYTFYKWMDELGYKPKDKSSVKC